MWKFFGPLGQFASLAGNNDASHSRGELINIGDMKRNFLVHDAGMNINVFNFGHPMTKTTFNSYILQLPDGDYSIYRETLCHDSMFTELGGRVELSLHESWFWMGWRGSLIPIPLFSKTLHNNFQLPTFIKSWDISDADRNNGTTFALLGHQGEGQKLSW